MCDTGPVDFSVKVEKRLVTRFEMTRMEELKDELELLKVQLERDYGSQAPLRRASVSPSSWLTQPWPQDSVRLVK